MKTIISKTFGLLSAVSVMMFLAGACTCDDLPWTNPEGSPELVGRVITNGNVPVSNATVVLTIGGQTFTTTTNADGCYYFNDIPEGECSVTASYDSDPDFISKTRSSVLVLNQVTVCNFLLVKASIETEVTVAGDTTIYQIFLPDIVESKVQIATYYVSTAALKAGDALKLRAWYETTLNGTKAATKADAEGYEYTGEDVIVCVEAKAESGATTTSVPFRVEVQQLVNPRLVTYNGKEVQATSDEEKMITWIETSELGVGQFYYPIMKKDFEQLYKEAVTFTPNEFYGRLEQIHTSCQLKYGSAFEFGNNFLDQYVAILENSVGYTTVETELSPYIYVPEGESIILKGWQNYQIRDYKCSSAHTRVRRYLDLTYKTQDRQHTGGSN